MDEVHIGNVFRVRLAKVAIGKLLLANGSSQKFIARRYGTCEVNLSRWLKKRRLK